MDQERFFQVVESISASPSVRSFPDQGGGDQDWAALDFAVENPIDCSPLKECLFPGDRVAVVVTADVAGQNSLLKSLTKKLLGFGCQGNEILIIQDPRQDSFQQTATECGLDVFCRAHSRETDDSEDGCSMVGVSVEGEPLYINRHIAEADVVIPVVSFCKDLKGHFGPGYLYPEFSNTDGLDRVIQKENEGQAEVRQVESIVNPFFLLAVGKDSVSGKNQVLFGSRQGIEALPDLELTDSWEVPGRQDCKAVVATLQNVEPSERFALATASIENALLVSQHPCPIILVMQSPLEEPQQEEAVQQEEFSEDEQPTDRGRFIQLIEQVTEDRPVYLFSPLGQDETEDLGLGYLESEQQLSKLIDRFGPAVCLNEAFRWVVTLDEE